MPPHREWQGIAVETALAAYSNQRERQTPNDIKNSTGTSS